MIINSVQTVNALAAASTRSQASDVKTTNTTDQTSFSDAVRMLQQNDVWQTALASRQNGMPKLIPVASAISGGVDALQKDMGQWLQSQGFDNNANFSVNYDASSQTFNVKGPAEIKNALEKELNGNSSNATGAAFRQSYSLLEDLSSSFAAVRQQYRMDQAAGGYDRLSREQGFSYSFSLDMMAGRLQTNLKPLGAA